MDMQKQKRKEKEREGVFGYDEASPHASVAPSCRQSSNVLLPKTDHRPKVRLGRASESRPPINVLRLHQTIIIFAFLLDTYIVSLVMLFIPS